MKSVTEVVLTPFGYPDPYRLHYVAQYRFVYQTGEFLVRRNKDQQIVGGLAESWTISDDRKRIVFHLRPNIYSATEVEQSLRRLLEVGQTTHSNFVAQIASIHVLGPREIELVTRGDASAVLSPLVMADAVLLPDDHWFTSESGSRLVDWRKTRGPYIWLSGRFPATVGEEIVYAPNPAHYLYEPDQLIWKIKPHDSSEVTDQNTLKVLLEREPSYCTLRYSNVLKLFSTPDAGLSYYQTRANGVAFILLNQNGLLFKDGDARRTLVKKVFEADFKPLMNELRGYQLPQPGLSARLNREDEAQLISEVRSFSESELATPIRWAIPGKPEEDTVWHSNLVSSLGLPITIVSETVFPMDPRWLTGEIDATVLAVGMSDTDPISGATFLFSPNGNAGDLPDGRIMRLLNSVKETSDPALITSAVRKAFRIAIEEGTMIPLYYTVNRHYYSKAVSLNISDPFAEQVSAGNVRITS